MKVFVTGATGYIGFAVAAKFAARGHQVMGLVRSAEKAKRLACAEILPVIGSMNDPESYTQAAQACELLVHLPINGSKSTSWYWFFFLSRGSIAGEIKKTWLHLCSTAGYFFDCGRVGCTE